LKNVDVPNSLSTGHSIDLVVGLFSTSVGQTTHGTTNCSDSSNCTNETTSWSTNYNLQTNCTYWSTHKTTYWTAI
jgi:hypothetical protein